MILVQVTLFVVIVVVCGMILRFVRWPTSAKPPLERYRLKVRR